MAASDNNGIDIQKREQDELDLAWRYLLPPTIFTSKDSVAAKGFSYMLQDRPAKEGDKGMVSDDGVNGYKPVGKNKNETELGDLIDQHWDEFKSGNSLFASAKVDGNVVPLGRANRFDQLIWDRVATSDVKHLQVLTMFTRDIQANYFLVWEEGDLTEFFCSFIEHSERKLDLQNRHFCTITENSIAAAPTGEGSNREIWDTDLSECILWNQFCVDEKSMNSNEADKPNFIKFHRRFVALCHPCRQYFQNVPLVTKPLNSIVVEVLKTALFDKNQSGDLALVAAEHMYSGLRLAGSWVAGVGAPMRNNLDQLGSAMANARAKITLVTGLPGTGKESYSKALHFAGKPLTEKTRTRLLLTTALQMETYQGADGKGAASKFCEMCIGHESWVTVFIDELNKVKQETRSELLRVLEDSQGVLEEYVKLKKSPAGTSPPKVRFILAASDHLDRLAMDPPQDFWTRITNQLRVAHPLGRVMEEDARKFLESFFWDQWWELAKDWLGKVEPRSRLVQQVLGSRLMTGEKGESTELPELVFQEFVFTVTPAAMRDEISIRGVRSMMQQIFANVIWSTRYGLVPRDMKPDQSDARTRPLSPEKTGDALRRAVNHAIQDVMAILNASRATPRTAG